MLPDHATGVAPGSTRLGAEARRQRREPHRQFLVVDDGFANEIGERYFGGGDETEPPASQVFYSGGIAGGREQFALDGPELILFEFRQLPRAEHDVVTYEQRRIDFGIAVLRRVQIEH